MSGWWYVLILVALAVVALLSLRARRAGPGRRTDDRAAGPGPRADFTADRESNRVAGMSEADRTWEAASLQRERDTRDARARADAPAPGQEGNASPPSPR